MVIFHSYVSLPEGKGRLPCPMASFFYVSVIETSEKTRDEIEVPSRTGKLTYFN